MKSYQIFTKESLSRLERLRSSLTALAIKGKGKNVLQLYEYKKNYRISCYHQRQQHFEKRFVQTLVDQ